MKMGGTGTRRQRSQDFFRGQLIPITGNSADLAHYFPENGGDYPPHSQKWGGRVPPVPPCGGAPARHPAQSADAGPLLVTGASPALHQHGCCHLAPPFKLAASRGEEGRIVGPKYVSLKYVGQKYVRKCSYANIRKG